MSKLISGSICLTDIIAKAKEGHSAFSTSAKNGKVYCNILVWENDEPDQYNNNFSVQLNAEKDAPESEKKQYIGNMKYIASNKIPVDPSKIDDDLSGVGKAVPTQSVTAGQDAPEIDTSLPF